MTPLIIITGPTAVGKTELAIWLASQLKTEIISADSMQIYRELDLGTAKPSKLEQAQAKHHLIDLVNPEQEFTVAEYQQHFQQTVTTLHQAGKIPLVVGGTGFYLRSALQEFTFEATASADYQLREKLKQEAALHGSLVLHQRLAQLDPVTAAKLHPHDLVRIIRALEVYEITGKSISSLAKKSLAPKYQTIYLFLNRDRTELYARIETRAEQMMAEGFLDEVTQLLEKGYDPKSKALQGLGYKQLISHLQGEISYATALTEIKKQTRHYAKRQLTWFRREPVDLWIHLSGNAQEFFGEILNYIEGRLKLMSNNL